MALSEIAQCWYEIQRSLITSVYTVRSQCFELVELMSMNVQWRSESMPAKQVGGI